VYDSISITYHGMPHATGFESFRIGNHPLGKCLWTFSEPYGAKDWWPCKQDLTDKTDSLDLYISTPKKYRAAGNGIL
ncbi:hypothetical protein N4A85_25685, partial [Escherichia coli]|uniref:hypothetical protein n=1 Tax=Escherichia coli TaxID=562 RepID=UPI0021B6CC5D